MIKACLHCGNDTKNVAEDFCCNGCSAAYKIINKLGFKSYYDLRKIDDKERKIKPENEEKIDLREFVISQKDGSFSISLIVQGIHCAACVWLIESILKKQENVIKARVNLSRKSLLLSWNGNKEDVNKIAEIIFDIGYKLLPFDEEIIKKEEKKYDDSILKALAVAGFGAGNIMFFSIALWIYGVENLGLVTKNLLHLFSAIIAIPVIIYSSRPFFSSAFKSIKAGYPNMDLAISIAIFLATIVSILESIRQQEYIYFDSAVMLLFFLLIGRYLDMKARKKAFSIATEFAILTSSFGRIEDDGKIKILPVKEIKQDMILIVAIGEKIAADGVVIAGESEVDASIISGETSPKKISVKNQVFAGMINLESPLRIRVTAVAENSLIAKIISLSEEVENKKNHYVRIADRLSKFYTPAVHLIAFLTFCLWCFYFGSNWEKALMNATAVLIITCPCALALAIPIVQTIAISSFIKKGILVKSGEALEKLREIDVVVFDKTGSLTIGKPELVDMFILKNNQKIFLNNEQKSFYLKLAASLSSKSKHPISMALMQSYDGNLEELRIQENKGFGLYSEFQEKILKLGRKDFCQIKNDVILDELTNENYLISFMKFGDDELVFLFSDQIKEDAKLVVAELKNLGKKIILLSGDIEKNVRNAANKTGIAEYYYEQTPLSKAEFLQNLKSQNHKILMIGDGINDAPSLAASDVSISFADAADISQNIADIVIQSKKLQPIINVINSSDRAISLMKQNLLIALIYNLIALPFAILGYVVPLIAAFAMSSSSILVLFNSLRMNKCQS
ncbi:MAG: cadmium-translocating P-type ATPase [Rickettsiales bacterium]|nr:cadmium-translocating P-type ATPase [Rickettsiales bacterium]